MKICISAESTIDLPQEILEEYGIRTIAFGINFGDKLVEDRFGISSEIFEYVEKTNKLPKTSAVSPEQFQEHFSKLKEEYDAIIHISLSSKLSCAYNNACMIAEALGDIYVIDSNTLSTGIALLALKAVELVNEKHSVEQIVDIIKEMTKRLQVSFVIEKLNFLHKGGRCSALTLLGANVLKIKPQISVVDGRMIVAKKFIGNLNKCVEKYCDELLAEHENINLKRVFLTRSSDMPQIQEMLKAKLQARGFEQVIETVAGGTISSHCGPNCIGILFEDN